MPRIAITAPLTTYLALSAVIVTMVAIIYPRMGAILMLWPFVHASPSHLISNMTMFLLLSPILEERHGAVRLAIVYVATTAIIGIAFKFVFGGHVIGASGHVFAAIGMVGFAGAREKVLPLHLLMLVTLYTGGEVMAALKPSNISHFAHLCGLAVGLAAGWLLSRSPGPSARSRAGARSAAS